MRVKLHNYKSVTKLVKQISRLKVSKGYLLIEGVVSLSVVVIISFTLYSLLSVTLNLKNRMNDLVELQQQSIDITKHIESLVSNSKGIISITPLKYGENNTNEYIDVKSIKLKYSTGDDSLDDKEIYLNVNRNKVFVNSLKNGSSQAGGYEIGDYVDNIYIRQIGKGTYIKVCLSLSKNSQKYQTKFDINILNTE